MKKSNFSTTSITVNTGFKAQTDKDGSYILNNVKVLVPLNVIDVEYFTYACQYWLNLLAEDVFKTSIESYKKQIEKRLESYDSADDLEDKQINVENKLKAWHEYMAVFKTSVFEIWEESIIDSFESDGFAKIYAISIVKAKSLNGVPFSFNACTELSQSQLFDKVSIFSANCKPTDSYKSATMKLIRSFCNDNFSTDGVDGIYKNISFDKLSFDMIQTHLVERMKNELSHNTKGVGINDTRKPSFTIALQLFFICMHMQGVPMVDGNKTITVYNAGGRTSGITVTRRKK